MSASPLKLKPDWKKTHWLIATLFAVVIVLEYSTPPPYVFGYLYIGAVLLASGRLGQAATRSVTTIAVLLTLSNLFIPGLDQISSVTIANRSITVMALMVTGWMSDRLQRYEKAITHQHAQIMAQTQLARMREDFVSTLTHDLKTPLLGAIETLHALDTEQFGPITSAQRRAITIMTRSHQTTLQLVETLMDVYRNDAEGLQLNPTAVDLVALAERGHHHGTHHVSCLSASPYSSASRWVRLSSVLLGQCRRSPVTAGTEQPHCQCH